MKTLTIREARQALSHLDEMLAAEGELTITRRGKAVARVIPLGGILRVPSHKALREKMPYQDVASEVLIREERDAR